MGGGGGWGLGVLMVSLYRGHKEKTSSNSSGSYSSDHLQQCKLHFVKTQTAQVPAAKSGNSSVKSSGCCGEEWPSEGCLGNLLRYRPPCGSGFLLSPDSNEASTLPAPELWASQSIVLVALILSLNLNTLRRVCKPVCA